MVDRSFWWYDCQICEQEEQLLGFYIFLRPGTRPSLLTVPEEAGGDENNNDW